MPIAKQLNRSLISFIQDQKLFFVATAAADGRVNLSPKGMETLLVKSETKIKWLNLSGSGNETAAHVLENPRMTLMFCAFDGSPMILRTYGNASIYHPHDSEWTTASSEFELMPGSRQVFELDIDLVQTSCGSGVPKMDFVTDRGPEMMLPHYAKLGEDGVRDYWERKNYVSLDGKPTGLDPTQ